MGLVNAYTLAFAGLLLLGGRVADLLDHKRLLLAGLVTFAVASLAGGLADRPAILIGARLVQGVAAAVLSPVTMAVLTVTFTGPEPRGKALAAWSASAAAGGVSGNLLGGLLTETLGWRWVLFVTVPLAAAAQRCRPGPRPARRAVRPPAGEGETKPRLARLGRSLA